MDRLRKRRFAGERRVQNIAARIDELILNSASSDFLNVERDSLNEAWGDYLVIIDELMEQKCDDTFIFESTERKCRMERLYRTTDDAIDKRHRIAYHSDNISTIFSGPLVDKPSTSNDFSPQIGSPTESYQISHLQINLPQSALSTPSASVEAATDERNRLAYHRDDAQPSTDDQVTATVNSTTTTQRHAGRFTSDIKVSVPACTFIDEQHKPLPNPNMSTETAMDERYRLVFRQDNPSCTSAYSQQDIKPSPFYLAAAILRLTSSTTLAFDPGGLNNIRKQHKHTSTSHGGRQSSCEQTSETRIDLRNKHTPAW